MATYSSHNANYPKAKRYQVGVDYVEKAIFNNVHMNANV